MSYEDEKRSIDLETHSKEPLGELRDLGGIDVGIFCSGSQTCRLTHRDVHSASSSMTSMTPIWTRLPSNSKMNRHIPKSGQRLPTLTTPRYPPRLSALGSSVSCGPSSFRVSTSSSFSDILRSPSARYVPPRLFQSKNLPPLLNPILRKKKRLSPSC
jgi:hypothetical protein